MKNEEKTEHAPHATINLPRGILKLKKGYNPNSSSIGTVVYAFPYAIPAISALVVLLVALLTPSSKRRK